MTTNFLADVTRRRTNILFLHVLPLFLSSDSLGIRSYHVACEDFLHLSHTGSDLDFRFSNTNPVGRAPNGWKTHWPLRTTTTSELRQNQVWRWTFHLSTIFSWVYCWPIPKHSWVCEAPKGNKLKWMDTIQQGRPNRPPPVPRKLEDKRWGFPGGHLWKPVWQGRKTSPLSISPSLAAVRLARDTEGRSIG